MTSYPKNTNPLNGPNWREAARKMMEDAEPLDLLMIEIDGPESLCVFAFLPAGMTSLVSLSVVS